MGFIIINYYKKKFMKLTHNFLFKGTLVGFALVVCSAVPIEKSSTSPYVSSTEKTFTIPKEAVRGDLNYKELKSWATELKGEKLSFKEKLALKLFNKKLDKLNENGNASNGGKNQLVALLLAIFVGGLGIHRFYLGYTWQGVVQLLTLGGCGIWSLIDLIRIITGDLGPKNGPYEKTL